MNDALRDFVRRRAQGRCEYCHLPEPHGSGPFCADHIIARKHHGLTTADNLAWACFRCNVCKGDNLSGIDPTNGKIVQLFHPRIHRWDDFFNWEGAELVGLNESARATIDVLCINDPLRVEVRRALLAEGIEM
jgi:hypothetical protein